LSEFARQEREDKITKAELARRIGRKPEQITRWLGSSGNWTLDTISDLLLGMGLELGLSINSFSDEQSFGATTVYTSANNSSWDYVPWLVYDRLQDCHYDPRLHAFKNYLEEIGPVRPRMHGLLMP
jgi:hypothetical protein